MLRVSREADLGIVLMARLAGRDDGRLVTARELADETEISLPMTSKVLKRLGRGGLLVSHLGARGGYSLARTPREISVAEILVALEGPIALTACIESSSRDCAHEETCCAKRNWQLINGRIEETLSAISLAELVVLDEVHEAAETVHPLRRGSGA